MTTLAPDHRPKIRHVPDIGDPLVGHLSVDPAKRVALCGAEILGVPAFGEFVRCDQCTVLWAEEMGCK